MSYHIPAQYQNPRFIQLDPDNDDPDVYDVQTGEIIDSQTNEVVGRADPGKADYDGSHDTLSTARYDDENIDKNTENVTKYLNKQKVGLDSKIKALTDQYSKETDPTKKAELEDELGALRQTSRELEDKISHINSATTPADRKKAVEDATPTSIEVDTILNGNNGNTNNNGNTGNNNGNS
ncbi:MAG TPA: hypothetical protein VJ654_03350 [Noviherbaspirillum sp.]|nr:hypothetical protein [Noviherbaspirillum sp.]